MMKNKYVFVAVMLCAILVAGMGLTSIYVKSNEQTDHSGNLTVVTSFYPVYIAAMNIVGDTEGVRLYNLSEPQTGCLHDFQLTPEDMKRLSNADVFIINGGGIESFMEEVAAAYPDLAVVEACRDVALISDEAEHGGREEEIDGLAVHEKEDVHDHDVNAHAWMSVSAYRLMVRSIAQQLGDLNPENGEAYAQNAAAYDEKLAVLQEHQQEVMEMAAGEPVILFHEAYAYVAAEYGMNVCDVMDLDEERQVSAGEVAEILAEIRDNQVSLILAEQLYGADMAETVQKEADVAVIYLSPLNRGAYEADSYLKEMEHNIKLLERYFAER